MSSLMAPNIDLIWLSSTANRERAFSKHIVVVRKDD